MIFFKTLTENYPFLSLLFSFILFFGLYQVGEIIFLNKKIRFIFLSISELKYQKILVATNFLMIFLFPVVLFFPHSRVVLIFFSLLIFLFGTYKILIFLRKKWNFIIWNQKYSPENIFFILIILGFFFITFSPINHADSIDYHLAGAIYIAQTGNLPTGLENFHNLLVGVGEVIMSLGIFFWAEQFGTLIQFSGLLSLIGVIKKFNKNQFFFKLLILSSPVIIFLTSSPKPQLFHISSNAIIFVLLFINRDKILDFKKYIIYISVLTNIFLINSINAKFSFVLSSFIIYILLFFFCYKKKFFLRVFFLTTIFLFLFYFTYLYWKFLYWGGDIFYYIFNPFPVHIEGMKYFKEYLINYKREDSIIYLFIPRNLNQFTDAIGIGLLIFIKFFLIKKEKYFSYIYLIILSYVLINYFFGQPSSRFFIELYIWMILLMASCKNLEISQKIKFLFYPQFVISTLVVWYGVITMSYGFFSFDFRDKVMNNTANGYSLFKWSNSIINKKEDRIISMHRSVALGRIKTISTNFLYYVNFNPGAGTLRSYHIKELLSDIDGKTYLLTYGSKDNLGIFSECIDYLYAEKIDVGRDVGRNPYNKSENFYNGYLYKLKNFKKSGCLKYD